MHVIIHQSVLTSSCFLFYFDNKLFLQYLANDLIQSQILYNNSLVLTDLTTGFVVHSIRIMLILVVRYMILDGIDLVCSCRNLNVIFAKEMLPVMSLKIIFQFFHIYISY